MKVEQSTEFQPITITLESEYEARVLKTLVGAVGKTGKFRNITTELYQELDERRIESFPKFDRHSTILIDPGLWVTE